ncbi:leucine-rich repeat, immunoglobulin-like domain and transmembrane domain-containing protein 3 [Melanotaenia boesemani]|uniref:leucine-rich repeat, immunoglobulin-like domain and transmembrane domain-containing protein 3 n=1 Tax=Melanotaenia boesemani TaxID=1250792 RepID=UPI001C052146|nr:leucine-rich repeat, immunoglobulin-like domain and transmembrane domain-containing protein 3 [Melanotaenia boesemani]
MPCYVHTGELHSHQQRERTLEPAASTSQQQEEEKQVEEKRQQEKQEEEKKLEENLEAEFPARHILLICRSHTDPNTNTRSRLVQCSDPEISAVPVNVPPDTVKLRLEKTFISKVPRAAFYNLSELRFLWLTYNSITTIHPSSFVNLKALRELRLDGNLLTTFPWEGLRDMPRLQTLGLHNNRLSSLPAHAALFLQNITYLDLSSNRLTILPAELLDLWFPLPGLEGGPVQRKILGLHDNPWLCDCQISMLTQLSMSIGSSVVLMDQLLMCSRSLGQSGMLLTQAKLSRCMRPSVQPAATRVISPLGSNVILRCDASGYPTPTLTWIKTTAYTDCCQQDILQNSEQLPRILESFMQASPRVGVRWSIISLNGLSYKDAGEYRCQARNMAGISEAPIKLKVMGISRLRRPPKKKSKKIPSKSPSRSRRPNQTPAASNSLSGKVNLTATTIPPSLKNMAQKAQRPQSSVFQEIKQIKRHEMNSVEAHKKTLTLIKSTSRQLNTSESTLSTLV